MFKKLFDRSANPIHNAKSNLTATFPPITANVTVPGTGVASQGYVYTSIGQTPASNIGSTINTAIGSGMFQQVPPTSIISFSKAGNQEIVRLTLDGKVEWTNGIDVDAAAEAFGRSLILAVEQRAGITRRVKLEMRDSVFNDLISIAKEKGSLTAEDLTYLLEASKIVEKLKGGE